MNPEPKWFISNLINLSLCFLSSWAQLWFECFQNERDSLRIWLWQTEAPTWQQWGQQAHRSEVHIFSDLCEECAEAWAASSSSSSSVTPQSCWMEVCGPVTSCHITSRQCAEEDKQAWYAKHNDNKAGTKHTHTHTEHTHTHTQRHANKLNLWSIFVVFPSSPKQQGNGKLCYKPDDKQIHSFPYWGSGLKMSPQVLEKTTPNQPARQSWTWVWIPAFMLYRTD